MIDPTLTLFPKCRVCFAEWAVGVVHPKVTYSLRFLLLWTLIIFFYLMQKEASLVKDESYTYLEYKDMKNEIIFRNYIGFRKWQEQASFCVCDLTTHVQCARFTIPVRNSLLLNGLKVIYRQRFSVNRFHDTWWCCKS